MLNKLIFMTMKKFTLFAMAVIISAFCATAQQTVNNPKDAEGFYIVKWDCANEIFATANDFEVDETFTFAVDITGTPWVAWLAETPTNPGASRSLALNKWTGFGDVSGDSHRLKPNPGKPNIYAATWNLAQLATTMDLAAATTQGARTYVFGQLFGFEYTSDNPGAGWWMWPSSIAVGSNVNPGTESGAIFATLPYTGTKTSEEFYNDDYDNELFGDAYPVKGYAPACAVITGIKDVLTSDIPIAKYEYYNLQGAKLAKEPEEGLFIVKAIRIDGSFSTKKILKPAK